MNEITTFNATGVEGANVDSMPHSIEAEQQLLREILPGNEVFARIGRSISH